MANSPPSSNTTHRRRASADDGLTRSIQAQPQLQKDINKSVWDCGSSLYDSFELYTFSQQLNRAITGGSSSARIIEDGSFRSLSMPHYISRHGSGTLKVRKAPPPAQKRDVPWSSRIVEDGRSRSLSMPHYVSSRGCDTFEFHKAPPTPIQEEEEEEDVLTYHSHLDFEVQRPHPKSNNRLRMGIPRVVQRFFSRAFFLKSKGNKHSAQRKEDRHRKDFERNIHPLQSHGQSEFSKWSARSAIKV